MIINTHQLYTMIYENRNDKIEYKIFTGTEKDLGNNEIYSMDIIVDTVNMKSYFVDIPEIETDLRLALKLQFGMIAEVTKNHKVVCKRESIGTPMFAVVPDLFGETAYEKLVEADLLGQVTGREMVLPKLTENTAGSIMRGFKKWREQGFE